MPSKSPIGETTISQTESTEIPKVTTKSSVTTRTTTTTTTSKSTSMSEKTITTDRNVTMPSTQSTTPQCVTHSSSSQITSPYSTTIDAAETTNITKTVPRFTTKKNAPCRMRITVPKFNYILINAEKQVACVLANMTIHINLQHATKDFQVLKSVLTVPLNATTTGICNEKTANMTLSWEEAKNQMNSDKKNKITFNYAHDNIKFFLDSIFIDVHLNDERIRQNTMDSLQLFSAAIKRGIFICEMDTTINIGNKIDVVISDIYLIVFNECFDDGVEIETCIVETQIEVSVIIGIIIVGIILIFFVFYLIWYTYHMKYIQKNNCARF